MKKAGKRLYMLYQLKRAGITQKDLVSVYVSVVRPVLEYACPLWHVNLPQYLSDNIEVIQKRALKCIFPGLGYAEILRRVNLDTLNVRRESICQKYFDKIKVGTHRLNYLLPDKRHTEYNIRQEMCTRYQLLERIDSVTPLYRGLYTTVSKKVISTV